MKFYSKTQFKKDQSAALEEISLKKMQIAQIEKEIELSLGNVSQQTIDIILEKANAAYDDLSDLESKLTVIEMKNSAYNGKVIHSCGNN